MNMGALPPQKPVRNSHNSKYFFRNRVVNVWNALEARSADFRTLQSFKRLLKTADILTHF